MSSRSIEDYRTRNEDAPLDLVRGSADWKPVIRLIDGWTKAKVDATSGYSSQELDDWSRVHGVRFPPPLREWWRLAGRHPFVDEPDTRENGNAWFLAPPARDLVRVPDFLAITLDDMQTWSGNGIHADFLAMPNPQVHGINGTIKPKHAPGLNWHKGKFIATGLSVPALIFTTLLYQLFLPNPQIADTAVYLETERSGLAGGEPEEMLVSELGLKRFPNDTLVGEIYSDGEDIIYWWLMGCACRTAEAAERVHGVMPTRPREPL